MKIVIAPDSYKGSLSAREVAMAINDGIKRVCVDIETVLVPLADGGEGTVDTLVDATSGEVFTLDVINPLGRKISAQYGVLGDKKTCVIEVASASGLSLLTVQERNPLKTTSYGTGQLILHGLNNGFRRFIIGLGGSATNDGGAGLLQALGARLIDENGQDIKYGGENLNFIKDIDLSQFDPRIKESQFIIANDVENPFIGPNGASRIFGLQKGASNEDIWILENNLQYFADLIEQKFKISIHYLSGAGAAGGIGGALLAFLNGKMEKGINLMLKATNLEQKMTNANLVITGEGRMDYQTSYGKAPIGVAQLAKTKGIPVIAIVGSIGQGSESLRNYGIDSIVSIINKPMEIEEAISNSYDLISYTSEQIIRIYLMNRTLTF